ncbi:MAG: sulfatase [Planctomycetaceae bacterium]|nr:sulfatase [Planctomycetaceae bacterium]
MNRRILKLLAILAVSSLVNVNSRPASAASRTANRPNVVLFLVDDMGWMDCGVYGSTYYETPNIDAFATRAMRFTSAYAQPLCSPTRASILSGQYSARHRITTASGHQPPQPEDHVFLRESAPPTVPMLLPESQNYLDPGQITLAETLKSAGYRTAHIGKWHLGTARPHWPEQQGFDVAFHCHPDPGPPGNYFSPYGVVPDGNPTSRSRVGTITDGPDGEYIVDRQADEAIRFIQSSKGQPFFLNLWCYGVHGPWGHKEEYTRIFARKQDPSGRQGNPIMASMLRSVDECFGRILKELDEQGLNDNTIIIFYSDNGGNVHSNVPDDPKTAAAEQNRSEFLADWRTWAGNQPPTMNTPLRNGKGTLYEGGTRVPLMWAWSNQIAEGSLSDDVVGPIDVYPTLLDLLHIEAPQDQIIDGVSYAGLLTEGQPVNRTAYFNYHPHAGLNRAGGVWVRSGQHKLIRWFGRPDTLELFDLQNDIGETTDLSAQMPDLVTQLNAQIDRFLADTGATYPRPNPAFKTPTGNAPQGLPAALDAWKQRACTASISDGILTVQGTSASGNAFLGHATGRMTGPAFVRLRLRSSAKGTGRIDCYPNGAGDDSIVFRAPFEVREGDHWQDITVEVKQPGRLGVLRLWLPVDDSTSIDIDRIEIVPDKGRSEVWEF